MYILAATSLILYMLGMYLMSQHFGSINRAFDYDGDRGPLTSGEKCRLTLGWPIIVMGDLITSGANSGDGYGE